MRNDNVGMFWQDVVRLNRKQKRGNKEVERKFIPDSNVWLADDYLPGLQDAIVYRGMEFMSEEDIKACMLEKREVIFDLEIYPNFFLIGFMDSTTGKFMFHSMDEEQDFDREEVLNFCKNVVLVGFNSVNFDIPVLSYAMSGASNEELKRMVSEIILQNESGRNCLKSRKVKELKLNHFDLMEVAPLQASLKIYGARLHTEELQDLPFDPEKFLNPAQKAITEYYCAKDLRATLALRQKLTKEIALREKLSMEYRMDLRSKSDAQIAEATIVQTLKSQYGVFIRRPELIEGRRYHYNLPSFLKFKTGHLQNIAEFLKETSFHVMEYGRIATPKEMEKLIINLGNQNYKFGIGGLHSMEKRVIHRADEETNLYYVDATSYYPATILNQRLYPEQLTPSFLDVYRGFVERRIQAKRAGDDSTANSLKITINGSYGKFGNMYSSLYSPQLLIQVTISGQLSLLYLIEKLETNGIEVISANTDGVSIKPKRSQVPLMQELIKEWERETGYTMEGTEYSMICSRDVNNYISMTTAGKFKSKGVFTRASLSKNPTNDVCIDAIENYIRENKPVEETIRTCTDIRQFLTVKKVSGGAVKVWDKDNIEYLGKSVRWYYGFDTPGRIVYAKNGNKVSRTEGAKPLMSLPKTLPDDIDYDWYVRETYKMLESAGFEQNDIV